MQLGAQGGQSPVASPASGQMARDLGAVSFNRGPLWNVAGMSALKNDILF